MSTGYRYPLPLPGKLYLLFAGDSSLPPGWSQKKMAAVVFMHIAWALYPYLNDVPLGRTSVSKVLACYDICTTFKFGLIDILAIKIKELTVIHKHLGLWQWVVGGRSHAKKLVKLLGAKQFIVKDR